MKATTVIFGANGFLGRYLCRHHARQGREVVAIARSRDGWSGDGMFLEWDGKTLGPWALALEGADTVINLTGRSVNCRYDEPHCQEILESRVTPTRLIGRAIAACKVPPRLWLNASTATWYRDARDEGQDEWWGEPGDGFSVRVARTWEEAFFAEMVPGATRKVAMRIGMVFANEPDTVFDVLRGLVRRGLGGAMGDGGQRISWIHMDDFLSAVDFLMQSTLVDGVVNVTAPTFPTNRELMRIFREAAGMPLRLPMPKWLVKLGAVLHRTEAELVLKSRWVLPRRLQEEGFRWRWPDAAPAVVDLRSRPELEGFFRPAGSRAIGASVWIPGRLTV